MIRLQTKAKVWGVAAGVALLLLGAVAAFSNPLHNPEVNEANASVNWLGDHTFLGIVSSTVATIDVDGATTFVVTRNVIQLTCTGAETITTITGGVSGQLLTLLHEDSDCTLNDTDNDTADQLDLVGANGDLVGAADLVIQLVYTGSHWLQANVSSQN